LSNVQGNPVVCTSVGDPYDGMLLGLPDPHPDPLVTSMDLAPDPSIIKLLYDLLSLKNDVNVPVFRIRIRIRMFLSLPDPHPDPLVRGTDSRTRPRIWIVQKCHGSPTMYGRVCLPMASFIISEYCRGSSMPRGLVWTSVSLSHGQ
jgi:hypothetical protein